MSPFQFVGSNFASHGRVALRGDDLFGDVGDGAVVDGVLAGRRGVLVMILSSGNCGRGWRWLRWFVTAGS
jgi:hypothetical protein